MATDSVQLHAIGQLRQMIIDDLDPDEGGLPWIRGQIDDKRCWLLSEYLCASATGVKASLLHAAFCIAEYKQNEYTENDWHRRRWAKAEKLQRDGKLPQGADLWSWGIRDRNSTDMKREHRLDVCAQMTLVFLVQALDRLGAVAAIVAASAVRPPLPKPDVLQIDWRGIRSIAAAGPLRGHELRHQSAAGQALQQRVYNAVNDGPGQVGPTDWLEWLLRARDTTAHRAPKMSWKALLQDQAGRATGFAEPFHAQPGWGEVETMLGQADLSKSLLPMLLNDTPESTMTGLLGSTADLAELVSSELITVVERRRIDPEVLVQPGAQWAEPLSVPVLKFGGYGNPPRTRAKEIMIHPDMEKRLSAARIGSRWEKDWRD